jgi:hypothetical protein
MANSVYVFCRSEHTMAYRQLEDHMGHMGFLDEPAVFDPPLDKVNADDPQWDSFTCTYRRDKRPIIVRHWITPEEIDPTRQELRERLAAEPSTETARRVDTHLEETRRVFVFEMPDDVPQDVWEMLDATEVFLARNCDGVIVASNGVFDAELRPLVTWTP